jgi:hypothetical protein
MRPTEAKEFFGDKSGTYHWDRVQIQPGLKMIVGAEQIAVSCVG